MQAKHTTRHTLPIPILNMVMLSRIGITDAKCLMSRKIVALLRRNV